MPRNIQLVEPPAPRHRLYGAVGTAILALNQLRYRVLGYRQPRPSQVSGLEAALRYDEAVVDNWLHHLAHYRNREVDLSGLRVLEVGPGPDLGTGLLLLARGARSYTAVDAHALVRADSRRFQLALASAVANRKGAAPDLEARLVEEVELLLDGDPRALHYRHLPDFDLDALGEGQFDLVVSHSALEHVEDPGFTLGQLGKVCARGAELVAEVDLQTHTRAIRDRDPLNIYRFSDGLYQGFHFSGQPNRYRPDEYIERLEASGWGDTRLYPKRVLPPDYVAEVEPHLDPRFQGDPERLGWLSFVVCGTRKGRRSWGRRED